MQITGQIGPFSIVPEWVLERELSNTALRLYIILGRYADWDTGIAFPSRETLAERMGVSERTVDRSVIELVEHKCIEKVYRGRYASALYKVLHVDPEQTDLSAQQTDLSTVQTDLSKRDDKNVNITITNERKPSKREPLKRVHSIPEDWKPKESLYADSRYSGIDIDREAERLRNWSLANGKQYKDWDAAFRNWLEKAIDFSKKIDYKESEKERQKRELDAWVEQQMRLQGDSE